MEVNGKTLDSIANGFSVPCDFVAPFQAVLTFDELERVECQNEILVLYGHLSTPDLQAKPVGVPVYYPLESRRINDILDEKKPAALILVIASTSRFQGITIQGFRYPPLRFPPDTGRYLLGNTTANIHLAIQSERQTSESWNVIGRQRGTKPERIVVCAHFDTRFYTPGAFDNASGTSILLSMAETLGNREWEYGLEFVAFNGEELGPNSGDDLYLEQYGLQQVTYNPNQPITEAEALKDILVTMNFDGVGHILGTNTIGVIQSSEALRDLVRSCIKNQYLGMLAEYKGPASNHYTFYSHGVPSIYFSCVGEMDIHHSPLDAIEWISEHKLGEANSVANDIVSKLMETSPSWTRKNKYVENKILG